MFQRYAVEYTTTGARAERMTEALIDTDEHPGKGTRMEAVRKQIACVLYGDPKMFPCIVITEFFRKGGETETP